MEVTKAQWKPPGIVTRFARSYPVPVDRLTRLYEGSYGWSAPTSQESENPLTPPATAGLSAQASSVIVPSGARSTARPVDAWT